MAAQELTTARSAENLVDQVPGLRQLLLLVGLAAAVALGVWVVLWSREDSYQVLFSNLADRDAVEIVQVLETAGVPYRYESGGGAVLVPSDQVHSARLQLASQDLPNSAGVGFEMLNESNDCPTVSSSRRPASSVRSKWNCSGPSPVSVPSLRHASTSPCRARPCLCAIARLRVPLFLSTCIRGAGWNLPRSAA